MFKKLKSHLYVLQLLEYNPRLFLDWVSKNYGYYPLEIKGKLGWSLKAKVLFLLSLLIQLIISIGVVTVLLIYMRGRGVDSSYLILFFPIILLLTYIVVSNLPALWLIIASLFLSPLEKIQKYLILGQASSRLKKAKNLKVIGITGSFGKTSVKHILNQILSYKFKTLATPESHNKILSVAQTVNRRLNSETQVFIAEMGAYKPGEIKEICRLVKPEIGVITGITIQHLSRFETLEKIKKAKYELVESLPKDKSLAVFNLNNQGAKELYEKCPINKVGYSTKELKIEVDSEVTTFNLFSQRVRTTLLGAQNVGNIEAAVAVAQFLDMPQESIIEAIANLKPIPHRLEPIMIAPGTTILDDAYSSNIEGYLATFNLIKSLNNYPKILVTPGLVELGKSQFDENAKMAKEASKIFDYAVVVNLENRVALTKGFLASGWTTYDRVEEEELSEWIPRYGGIEKDKIVYIADTLAKATREIFPKITKPNSLILLENDLPDIYR